RAAGGGPPREPRRAGRRARPRAVSGAATRVLEARSRRDRQGQHRGRARRAGLGCRVRARVAAARAADRARVWLPADRARARDHRAQLRGTRALPRVGAESRVPRALRRGHPRAPDPRRVPRRGARRICRAARIDSRCMAAARSFVLGTAGHIDHGKTALVRALTGVDTDRLPEEKRRGITIELGFARWQPNEQISAAVVDMPGHEALVRTMIAGAGGIDVVLLVIAAEDGVMPQTREHLHVCELLGLQHAVVALSKIDRLRRDADGDQATFSELLELIREDVRGELAGGPFAEAPVIPVSAHTGEGLAGLERALLSLAQRLPARARQSLPVLPIDRVFSLRGHGTVVTGTLLSGEIDLDAHEELE